MLEFLKKARACQNKEELIALAKEYGMELALDEVEKYFASALVNRELSDSELDDISGGMDYLRFLLQTGKCIQNEIA